jgi:hypothetical protein
VSTIGLSPVAAYVLRSLRDHPDLRFPDAIASGPVPDQPLDVQEVKEALKELEARGLVEEEPGRGWRLVDAARGG